MGFHLPNNIWIETASSPLINIWEGKMILVIFEFIVKPGKQDAYFEIAREMQSEVEKIDGFLGVERFQSTIANNKFLSVSRWRDEAAVEVWRTQLDHRAAQEKGKKEIFEAYTLRTVNVLRETVQKAP
jgi:heme-degrading monooxygenase HmoA